MFDVEIRVAGAVDPSWVNGALTRFTADQEPPVTTIRGVMGQGEDLLSIVGILQRHGLTPIDVWVDRGALADTGRGRPSE